MFRKRRNNEDVFGQELLDCYSEKRIAGIIERSDGYIQADSRAFKAYFADHKDWPLLEKRLIQSVRGKVLNVGCGAGRHSLFLQKKGYDVLNLDKSPLAVRVSKLRGVKNTIVMPLEEVGRLSPIKFDTILMIGGDFGLFGNFKKARRLLKKLYTLTNPNAVIVSTTQDPYKTKSSENREYHKWNVRRGRMGGQVRIRIRYKNLIGPWFDYLFVSQKELSKVLAGTGWKIRKVLDREDDQKYGMILEKISDRS